MSSMSFCGFILFALPDSRNETFSNGFKYAQYSQQLAFFK